MQSTAFLLCVLSLAAVIAPDLATAQATDSSARACIRQNDNPDDSSDWDKRAWARQAWIEVCRKAVAADPEAVPWPSTTPSSATPPLSNASRRATDCRAIDTYARHNLLGHTGACPRYPSHRGLRSVLMAGPRGQAPG